jgi:hypothetical protein
LVCSCAEAGACTGAGQVAIGLGTGGTTLMQLVACQPYTPGGEFQSAMD